MSDQSLTAISVTTTTVPRLRIRIFVDFWNFSLALRSQDQAFRVDWRKIGALLTAEAGSLVDSHSLPSYEGLHVYGSFDPAKANDAKLRNWFTNVLD